MATSKKSPAKSTAKSPARTPAKKVTVKTPAKAPVKKPAPVVEKAPPAPTARELVVQKRHRTSHITG